MRNQELFGYVLHHKPYKESRALYYFFSADHGVVHGIGKKGMPLFEPIQLFATGKRALKTFSQMAVQRTQNPLSFQTITGESQYAALYLNEVLVRLLPVEDAVPSVWQSYADSLMQLKQSPDAMSLRMCLRAFEQVLFMELGYMPSLTHDSQHEQISETQRYRFVPEVGLVRLSDTDDAQSADDIASANARDDVRASELEVNSLGSQAASHFANHGVFLGHELLAIAHHELNENNIKVISRLYRLLIDHLLDHQPLQSRRLWQQQRAYQSKR